MPIPSSLDSRWPALVSALSGSMDLDVTVRQSGALLRRRAVADGATLLRLALAYGPGNMGLRSAAAWAGLQGVALLSDVALMKRLQGAADWLGRLAGTLLSARQPATPLAGRSLRIIDASAIAQPGSCGTDWRLHATYDPQAARFVHLELTDAHGAEGWARAALQAGDAVLGDRFYARPLGLQDVLAAKADFIVRVGWSSLRAGDGRGPAAGSGEPIYSSLVPGEVTEREVLVEQSGKGGKRRGRPLFRARLIVMRKDERASAQAEQAARRSHSRRRKHCALQPLTIAAAGFVMLLTSLPPEAASAADVLATCRLRWQVELAFQRLKSGLGIDRLAAKGERLARSWLLAHLIVALLIDEAVQDVFASPPCAPARRPQTDLTVAAA